MLVLRKRDWDDKEYDNCGNTAVAVLEIYNITLPLCSECVDDLTEDIREYNNTVFCHKCAEFVMSKDGWRYGGSCKKKAEQCGKTITTENAGYYCCVDCLDACKDAKPLEVQHEDS